jgi:hypothetical protein
MDSTTETSAPTPSLSRPISRCHFHHDAIAGGIARTAEQNYGLSGVVLSESR